MGKWTFGVRQVQAVVVKRVPLAWLRTVPPTLTTEAQSLSRPFLPAAIPAARVAVLFCGLFGFIRSESCWAQAEPKPVEIDNVVVAEIQSGHRVVGTVQPLRVSTVGSAVDGRVAKLHVDQGQAVTQAGPIAQVLTATLQIELAAAQAERALFEQQEAELKNGSRPEDIAQARANLMSAKATLLNARSKLERIKSLASTRAASTAELDDAQQQYDAAKFAVEATDALLQRIQSGPRRETIAQAEARVELQKQRCALLEDRISKCTIRAPFDGFVAAKHTEVGAWISQGDPVAQIVQLDIVEVVAPVTAEAAVNLRPGDPVRIEFPELPNELLVGQVDRIVPIADARARTFPVRIRLDNIVRDGTPMLLGGMLARVDLPTGKREILPLVPKDALVLNGNDRAVFVADLDTVAGEDGTRYGTVRKVPVTLGVATDDRIQVKGAVQADDVVVVVGNERLVPNAKIKVVGASPPPLPQP